MIKAVSVSVVRAKRWVGLGRKLWKEWERVKGTNALIVVILLFTGWEKRSLPRGNMSMESGVAGCATIA
jgi:hypothetical protein